MGVVLGEHQLLAINQLSNGKILCADVGTGKSRTALAYFYLKECGGSLEINGEGETQGLAFPKDLYIITTAKKRDDVEWERECAPFGISTDRSISINGIQLTVDSWNNIRKYVNVCNAFFIFDEQRLTGSGPWVRAFYRIAEKNHWILLSATPGDKMIDYAPMFIANGYYKNITEFKNRHVIYNRYRTYKIDGYREMRRLERLKESLLVDMEFVKPAESHHKDIIVSYNKLLTTAIMKERWNVYENKPIRNISELGYLLRKVSNTDDSRISAIEQLVTEHPKTIIFYNFDYELEILRDISDRLNIERSEWNGHMHQPIPKSANWMYLVQYTAGAEGWNCIETNVIIFYSQSYSYRTMVQAAGRIDRANTPFQDLYYYHVRSMSNIDRAIYATLQQKKKFNERKYFKKFDFTNVKS